jgi:predicted  nucleic acid-binding Zn-ribbon protein
MDFQKYIDNLHNQLKAVNADIVEKEEEMEKLKDFRARIKGGLEVVNQIKTDAESAPPPLQLQQEIRQEVEQMARHGSDMDTL